MILASVPSDDLDGPSGDDPSFQEAREDIALYGHSQGNGVAAKGRTVLKAKALQQRIRGLSAKLDLEGDDANPNFRLALFGACCCLGVVGIGASIALLQRYAAETEAATTPQAAGKALPLLAVFSYSAPETNAALAWLAARLLSGAGLPPLESKKVLRRGTGFLPANRSIRPFIPDGSTVKVWRPARRGQGLPLQALAHGGVAGTLRRVHGLWPPKVRDLTHQAGGAAALPEADVFLEIRRLFSRPHPAAPAAAQAAHSDLVLISHPHHLPYLLALAQASGFEARVLDPAIYSSLPWSEFGCNSLGYSAGAGARAGVEKELTRLGGYVEALRDGDDPQRLTALRPVLEAANATLRFFWCAAANSSSGDSGGAAAACQPPR